MMMIQMAADSIPARPNERAQFLLKVLIQRFISDGQPVGSTARLPALIFPEHQFHVFEGRRRFVRCAADEAECQETDHGMGHAGARPG